MLLEAKTSCPSPYVLRETIALSRRLIISETRGSNFEAEK